MASGLLLAARPSRRAGLLVLALAALVLGSGAALRSTEYDETYTRLVTSPVPRPAWPEGVFTPEDAAPVLDATAGPVAIARNLRKTDVHPPLYFWLAGIWRQAGGTSVEALRALSVLLALGAVAAFMGAASVAGLPPLATGLGTVLSFGFAYTGGVARGFALGHLLLGLGTLAMLLAWRRQSAWWAAGGGLAAGGASFANYLAAFPGAALVAWPLLAPLPWRKRIGLTLAAGLAFTLVQLGNLAFFLVQRGSRPDQFEAFDPLAALRLIGQFNAANLFGGLPLYAEGPMRALLAAALSGLLLLAAAAVALRWRAIGPTRWLWLGGFLAPSAGLLLLSAASGALPIELRYLAFAAPFAAALLAGAAAGWSVQAPRLAPAAFVLVLLVQAAGAVGMVLHPATRQAYRDAFATIDPLLGSDTLLLVPRGNDGVGIVGAVLAEAPPHQPMLILRSGQAAMLPSQLNGRERVVLLGITDRDGAEQAKAARAVLASAGGWVATEIWRDDRRGFAATLIQRVRPGPISRMADRAESLVVRGTNDGGEEP